MRLRIYILVFFLFSTISYCQLPNFSLSVQTANETCDFNGSVTITLTNTTPGSTILHSLYKLPNLVTPIDQFSSNFRGNLESSGYRLVTTQTLDTDSSNPQQVDFTILDQVIDMDFDIIPSAAASCDDEGGILTINITQGRPPFFYEIIDGPELVPLQMSNVFTGLPAGNYKVRVLDGCGVGRVRNHLLLLDTTQLTVSLGSSATIATSCTSVEVLNTITPTPGTSIIYPLSIVYTIHPPDGSTDIVISEVINSGSADSLELLQNITLFGNDPFSYDIVVTDNCLFSFFRLGNQINPNPSVVISATPNPCGEKRLNISVSNFTPPYTIDFIDAPSGFVPADFNPGHLGNFSAPLAIYGSDTNPVPHGFYKVEITDSCMRTIRSNLFEVTNPPPTVNANETHATCTSPLGSVRISLTQSRDIVSAIVVIAPSDYTPGTPNNVSSSINSGTLNLNNLPPGNYSIQLVDNCGVVLPPKDFTINAFVPGQPNPITSSGRPSCIPNMGSIRIRASSGNLISVILTSAPEEFDHELPIDFSSQIDDDGAFYMNELPPGNYSFIAQDNCANPRIVPVAVPIYNPGINNFNFQRNCGSFHLTVTDNSDFIGSYWFQKFDPVTNNWEHPDTGTDHTNPSALPNVSNAREMTNLSPLLNLTYLGTFRIVKVFSAFGNGNARCTDIFGPFDFTDSLEILGAYTLDCINGSGPSSVYLDVAGVPPYQFRIVKKDGLPFVVENGNNNIFENLPDANYEFQVEDSCGNLKPLPVTPGNLLPLVKAHGAVDGSGNNELLQCFETGEVTATFNLNALKPSILGNQSAENYRVTYHATPADAASGTNPLPEMHTTSSTHETIYVRVMHRTIGICYDTTSFGLFIGEIPVINTSPDAYLCDGDQITISADPGFDGYEWSTGETTSSIIISMPGVYTVVGMNMYGTSVCTSEPKTITVTPSGTPTSINFDIVDWTEYNNSIAVQVGGNGVYEYSLNGSDYQESNLFENLTPGIYTIFVRDTHGCGTIDKEVIVLNYPKFFTPNGDGYNDKWQIKFAAFEPNMKIRIYDRYGKLISVLDSKSPGWDGTHNGEKMPSTDYWFVVERADGRVLRGHFAMKR